VTLRYRTTEPGTNGAVVLEHASQSLRASLTPTTDTKAIQSIDLGKLHLEPGALSPLTLKMPGPDRPKTQIFEIWLQVD
jgi:hypothetical protein